MPGKSPTATPSERIARFEIPCGRPRCTYVYTYEGTNLRGDIPALVSAHLDDCPGRDSRASCEDAVEEYAYGRVFPPQQAPHEPLPPSLKQLSVAKKARVGAGAGAGPVSGAGNPNAATGNKKPPSEVVCRGCESRVTLDRRADYAPALWEKHRNRCPGVKKQRSVGREKARRLHQSMTGPAPEPAYQPMRLEGV
ncbi:hypothetical protein B0H17DRAFT_1200946 [Mycena rosella]|uniref:Uncharacterized protein n=1 Tax=Mycena rosella TaxID=1033263 RepID=A0AAD7DHJ0_MYCRO|nr:hypothetical protein B0H17DRAFT_1200946 [Mycena rosella]